MSTRFLKRGNSFIISSDEELNMHDELPAGNYIIQKSPMGELYLEQIENFTPVSKMYGHVPRYTERVITTFWDRQCATGVMAVGEKGSGKTLLTKNVCIELAKQGVPTIVINSPWCGDQFNNLIQSIQQPCVVLFDEFEKVYSPEDQEKILTLLDGVFPSRKLFLITSNDKYRVDRHMRNRPGRIYYMFDFVGLDETFIREYCADNLVTYPQYTDDICRIASLFGEFNFDMLSAFVQEVERYGERPQELVSILNCKPEFDVSALYDVAIYSISGKKLTVNYPDHINNPLQRRFEVGFFIDKALDRTVKNSLPSIDIGEAISKIVSSHALASSHVNSFGFANFNKVSQSDSKDGNRAIRRPIQDLIKHIDDSDDFADMFDEQDEDGDDDTETHYTEVFSIENLANIDSDNKTFVFTSASCEFVAIVTKQRTMTFNYNAI